MKTGSCQFCPMHVLIIKSTSECPFVMSPLMLVVCPFECCTIKNDNEMQMLVQVKIENTVPVSIWPTIDSHIL